MLEASLRAAEPGRLVRAHLRDRAVQAALRGVSGRVVVAAIGKASAAMAGAAQSVLGSRLREGIVVAPAPAPALDGMRRHVASHPLPDVRGLEAARDVETLAQSLGPRDLLLLLLSGGASALLPAPAPGLSLADKVRTTELLLRAGADIRELNAVRKHLSRL